MKIKQTQLKILQVVPYFYPAWAYGGIPRVVYELSRELVRKGHEVTVYTTDVLDRTSRCDMNGRSTIVEGINVHYRRNLSNALAYHYQFFLPCGIMDLVKKTVRNFDLLHLHGHRHFLNSIVHHYAKKKAVPYLFSGHGTVARIERRIYAKTIFDRLLGNAVLHDAARFVAVSDAEVMQYQQMGIDATKVDVIYNGIDVRAFQPLPSEGIFRKKYGLENKKVILYLGKITPRKGVDFLVRAFSLLQGDDTILVIAGNDMGFRKKIEELIVEKKVGSRILFTGLITGEDKTAAYQDADVLVYPAIHEIFGLVPFEAIMCGTPVIVTDDCGCGEIIREEGIGVTVRYGDVEGLAEKIKEALKNRDAGIKQVKLGREFITGNLSWEKIADEYIRVYNGILS